MTLNLDEDGKGNLAFFVASDQEIAIRMYKLLDLKPGQTVYDLGCGHGDLLLPVKTFGLNGVGFEIDYIRAHIAEERMRANNLPVRIINDDFTKKKYWNHLTGGPIGELQIANAHGVLLYLTDSQTLSGVEITAPLLKKELTPGTRIVSQSFRFPDWWECVECVDIEGLKTLFLYEV